MAQFPRAQLVAESTPGPPRGTFFEWVQKPPKGALLVRGSTFLFNSAITEAQARAWCPDPRVFRQEIECSTFGHGGDAFLDAERALDALDQRDEWKGTAGPLSRVVSLDAAALHDYFAIASASPVDDEIAPGKPIRHVVLRHVEHHKGSRDRPIRVDDIVRRALALAEFKSPIVFDQHLAVEVKSRLEAAGYREVKEIRELRGRRMMQLSTSASAQTARFMLLREVVHGKRLHVPNTAHGRALVDELAALRATELAGGLLRVEGVGSPDDLADACAGGVEVCVQGTLSASDRSGARIEFRADGAYLDHSGLLLRRPRWVRVDPRTGRETPVECPRWAPEFDAYARESIAKGIRTAAIIEWEREQAA